MSLSVKRISISIGTGLLLFLLLYGCGRKKKDYSLHAAGYYYKLLAFTSNKQHYFPGHMMHLSASFATQADSVFWDSYNNLNDNFFLAVDSAANKNFLGQHASRSTVGDSFCLLIRPGDFFLQQFQTTQLPFFSRNDSVVKVRFKVKEILSPKALADMSHNLAQKEQQQIDAFIAASESPVTKDALGFYWLSPDDRQSTANYKPGTVISIAYRGYYLNGRFLEASPEKFEFVYGTPDQLLKGLNYVIPAIKVGQNIKIILPSRLAFGENGSSNGIVPPYTPLLYEIKIINVKE